MIEHGTGMDAIRNCEAEIWRGLAATMRLACTSWEGSAITRQALQRVSRVIEDQLFLTSGGEGGHA